MANLSTTSTRSGLRRSQRLAQAQPQPQPIQPQAQAQAQAQPQPIQPHAQAQAQPPQHVSTQTTNGNVLNPFMPWSDLLHMGNNLLHAIAYKAYTDFIVAATALKVKTMNLYNCMPPVVDTTLRCLPMVNFIRRCLPSIFFILLITRTSRQLLHSSPRSEHLHTTECTAHWLNFPNPWQTLGLTPPILHGPPFNNANLPPSSPPTNPSQINQAGTQHTQNQGQQSTNNLPVPAPPPILTIRRALRVQTLCWHPDKSRQRGFSTHVLERVMRRITWAAQELEIVDKDAGWREWNADKLPVPSLAQILDMESADANAGAAVGAGMDGAASMDGAGPGEKVWLPRSQAYCSYTTVDFGFCVRRIVTAVVEDVLPSSSWSVWSWRVWGWVPGSRGWLREMGKLDGSEGHWW